MSKRPAPVSASLKAGFREEARRIIRADRAARKTGSPQNTIGAITNALERAFKLGRDNPDDSGAPDRTWEQIPPRAREVLIDIAYHTRMNASRPRRLKALVDEAGRSRWIYEGDDPASRTYASVAISPLVKLKLLTPALNRPDILELSPTGSGILSIYWARREAEDTTLPLEGMRPTKRGY